MSTFNHFQPRIRPRIRCNCSCSCNGFKRCRPVSFLQRLAPAEEGGSLKRQKDFLTAAAGASFRFFFATSPTSNVPGCKLQGPHFKHTERQRADALSSITLQLHVRVRCRVAEEKVVVYRHKFPWRCRGCHRSQRAVWTLRLCGRERRRLRNASG